MSKCQNKFLLYAENYFILIGVVVFTNLILNNAQCNLSLKNTYNTEVIVLIQVSNLWGRDYREVVISVSARHCMVVGP